MADPAEDVHGDGASQSFGRFVLVLISALSQDRADLAELALPGADVEVFRKEGFEF